MIAATRRWFRRNRANLAIGAGIIGAGYLAGQYVLNKVHEARQRMAEERIAKENLRRRFQQNQEDCTYTVLALLPTVREEIFGALPVEQITEQLQQERQERLRRSGTSEAASTEYPSVPPSVIDEDGKSISSSGFVHASQMAASTSDGLNGPPRPKRTKAQLWQDMKINSIARALTLIYTLSLLTLFTRIQLNLLGRRTYLSSVVALASPQAVASSTISLENRDDDNNFENVYGNDFETNRKYLTFSWWLLHRGSKQIMQRVLTAVQEVFGAVNIREDLTLERLSELILQVRKNVEGADHRERSSMKWLPHLLPNNKSDEAIVLQQSGMSDGEESASPQSPDPQASFSLPKLSEDDHHVHDALRRLLDETSDLIDSPTFSQIMTRLLDAAFSHLVDYRIATEAFKAPAPDQHTNSRVTELIDHKCKLAHVLPVFCKQAHAIAAGSGELDVLLDDVAAQEGIGNEYLAAIDQVQDLEGFAAVIYSSNFDYELAEGAGVGISASSVDPQQADVASEESIDEVRESLDVAAPPVTDALPISVPAESPVIIAPPVAGATTILAPTESTVIVPQDQSSAQEPESATTNFEAAWDKATAEQGTTE